MRKFLEPIDITGKRFGKLVAIKYAGRSPKNNRHTWLCQCDCGKTSVAQINLLMCGNTKSCGCNKRKITKLQLTGMRFGKLVVTEQVSVGKSLSFWLCKCDCGNEVKVAGCWLTNGNKASCGCRRAELNRIKPPHLMHGRSKTTEYRTYYGAMNRCNNPDNRAFPYYGGRGIKFLFKNFGEFMDTLGERPSMNYSLDRIDVNGHYEPSNCRWATWQQQARNKQCENCIKLKRRILELEHKLESLAATSLDS